MKLKEGTKVRLKANQEEGWPEEFGKVEESPDRKGMTIVRVDQKYRQDLQDDGIREVHVDDLEVLKVLVSQSPTRN